MVKQYFNIKEKLVDCGMLQSQGGWWTGKQAIIVVAARRIGKTTSIWDMAIEMWETSNFKKLMLYIRNSEEELKAFAKSFNEDYKGRYMIRDTHIYHTICDPEGKILKKSVVGLVGAISTFSKLKSAIRNTNFHLVFYDEFNGMDTLVGAEQMQFFNKLEGDLFYYWTELLITIEGASPDLLAVITGNKVNAQNDILLKMGVELTYDNNPEDIWVDRTVTFKDHKVPIWFLNGGSKQYESIKETHLLTSAFATYDPKCNTYYNENGFYQPPSKNVISRYRMNKEIPRYYFGFKKTIICLYEDPDPKKDCYYFDEIEMPKNEELIKNETIYPFDYECYTTYPNAALWDDDDKAETADQLSDWLKNEKIYFSSNWLKANIMIWLRNNNSYGV